MSTEPERQIAEELVNNGNHKWYKDTVDGEPLRGILLKHDIIEMDIHTFPFEIIKELVENRIKELEELVQKMDNEVKNLESKGVVKWTSTEISDSECRVHKNTAWLTDKITNYRFEKYRLHKSLDTINQLIGAQRIHNKLSFGDQTHEEFYTVAKTYSLDIDYYEKENRKGDD